MQDETPYQRGDAHPGADREDEPVTTRPRAYEARKRVTVSTARRRGLDQVTIWLDKTGPTIRCLMGDLSPWGWLEYEAYRIGGQVVSSPDGTMRAVFLDGDEAKIRVLEQTRTPTK